MKLENTLYGQYIAERAGGRILESDEGFIVYRFDGRSCYIIEMFILPQCRKKGAGKKLIEQLEEVARDLRAEKITANVYLEDRGSTTTVIAALSTGFKVISAQGGVLYIERDITKTAPSIVGSINGVTVVQFDPAAHLEIITRWFCERNFPAPNQHFLPPTGLLACSDGHPVACGFLFRTDARIASIAHLGTDPKASGEQRNAALDILLAALGDIAFTQGFELVSCSTNLPKLMERFERLGFEKTDHDVCHFRRVLKCL